MADTKKPRKVKCFMCLESSPKDEMTFIEKKKRWVHNLECLAEYEWQAEMAKKDNEELTELCNHIAKLHDLVDVPKEMLIRLRMIRRGSDLVKGKEVKKWKNGASFSLLLEAYFLSTDTIHYYLKNKFSDDNRTLNCLNYCLSVAIGNLNDAYGRRQRKIEMEEIKQRTKETTEDKSLPNTIVYKPKKDEMDISKFL